MATCNKCGRDVGYRIAVRYMAGMLSNFWCLPCIAKQTEIDKAVQKYEQREDSNK